MSDQSRELPEQPSLRFLKVEAKRRLAAGEFATLHDAQLAVARDHGLSSIGLRPWTVYGVGRDFGMTSEPTKAIKAVTLGRPYRISYGGRQDLQYVGDVVGEVADRAASLAGYRMSYAPRVLRHFTAEFEPLAPALRQYRATVI